MLTTLLLTAALQLGVSTIDATPETVEPQSAEIESNDKMTVLPVIEVISARQNVMLSVKSSLAALTTSEIRSEAPRHPNEIFDHVPGVWVSNGSGQEHLSAIRSPVLTGAGACGAFMVLEDEIPTRPAGFCNVNQLFEVNVAQAGQILVLRGPGTVTYGSNALHGAIDILTPGPSTEPFSEVALELGSNDYYRGRVASSTQKMALQANYVDSGSFRDDEHFQHALVNFQTTHSTRRASGRTSFAYARLNQDTAGFILGKNAYKNVDIRTINLNPDAFRKAWAARLSSRWNWQTQNGHDFELIPYARASRMGFLQHFLPGTPLEHNQQDSAGLLLSWSNTGTLSAGLDLEWARGSLTEFQRETIQSGSAFLKETRPQGYHYDYEVTASSLAGWSQWHHKPSQRVEFSAGMRWEYLYYNYDNRMLDGNTRDDGTVCGFGGCLYTRPSDRTDSFTNFSPELGISFALNEQHMAYLRASGGFRAPQATELYRLQKGQTVADLDSETLDSIEIGLKGFSDNLSYELIAYFMRKQNFIFRDANGFNISDGKTRHAGLESLLHWQISDTLSIDANLSWSQHEYDSSHLLGRGETILAGNKIDTAPAWLAGTRMLWQRNDHHAIEAEWVYQGAYFLDAANDHRYPGHRLLNLRGWIHLANSRNTLALRVTNLLDKRYAERADFAFGHYRYFPGAGRRISLEWMYRH